MCVFLEKQKLDLPQTTKFSKSNPQNKNTADSPFLLVRLGQAVPFMFNQVVPLLSLAARQSLARQSLARQSSNSKPVDNKFTLRVISNCVQG